MVNGLNSHSRRVHFPQLRQRSQIPYCLYAEGPTESMPLHLSLSLEQQFNCLCLCIKASRHITHQGCPILMDKYNLQEKNGKTPHNSRNRGNYISYYAMYLKHEEGKLRTPRPVAFVTAAVGHLAKKSLPMQCFHKSQSHHHIPTPNQIWSTPA